ncbi:SMC-Scp complex subunit ScpB [Timonella sp. A28]|uniref:SMC-Scp complex subunit ScpB n=1 Tax=Timonella sp. A28 TaxID=3442640 RepID=UPI003EC06C09
MNELHQQLEAILMVTDEPIDAETLSDALDVPEEDVRAALTALKADYEGQTGGPQRGFILQESGAGWRIYSAPQHADAVAKFVMSGKTAKLSPAALETLAVIAYRQPVTRSQIASIRGVNVDGVIRTLIARELITEAPTQEASGATHYKTTRYFMERMGVQSLKDLPPLAPSLPPIGVADEIEELVASRNNAIADAPTPETQ